MPIVLIVICAVFLIFAFIGAYVFLSACVRTKEFPWLDKEAMDKTPYGRFYDGIVYADTWLKEHTAADLYITSRDGLKLHGRWIPAQNAKGTIILAHGYRSTYLVDFSAVLDLYHDAGLNILLPDQRAHGKSEGKVITFGVKESSDMLMWLDYHNKTSGDIPVLLSGLSMGASTIMYLADEKLPSNVKGLIVDCGFTTPKAIISSVFTSVTHLPAFLCIWSTGLCARIFGGFSLTQKDSRISLAKNQLPIIMIHGLNDTYVPCRMTEEAYAVCGGPKQILLVEGAEHGVSFLFARERYTKMIKDFINQYIICQ